MLMSSLCTSFVTLSFLTSVYFRPSFKLNICVLILEEFLKRHKFVDIFQEQSALNKDADLPMYNWRSDGRVLLWDTMITEMAALPDKMANKLKSETRYIHWPVSSHLSNFMTVFFACFTALFPIEVKLIKCLFLIANLNTFFNSN